MTAYNVVRMRVKPGRNEDYLEAHRAIDRGTFAGMKSVAIIQTGERDFCLIVSGTAWMRSSPLGRR